MRYKQFLPLALAYVAYAQNQTLTDALGSQNGKLSSFSTLLQQIPELVETLNEMQNITILAPDNDALKALDGTTDASKLAGPGYLQALLTYHVLNGSYLASSFGDDSIFIPTMLTNQTYANVTGGQRVEAQIVDSNLTFFSGDKQNVSLVTSDIGFSGGTIHIIDGLLSIPMNDTVTLSNANLTAAAGAIREANLTDTLVDSNDITIFAPNNDAFEAISSLVGNITSEQLISIIGYHIVNSSVHYSTTLQNTTLQTVSGQNITINVINGTVFANSARVTVPDILAENGVIHVVDSVLNPNNTEAVPDETATTATPAFPGASSATTGIPFTSGIATPTTTYPAATSADITTTTTEGAAMPMKTGAVGAVALFGGAAVLVNW
ncbi:FAS1 domain-containing protein [Xylariaceae sp. FL0662B]|nr:FAS1 domain-containing protein [Xylariaceae sp. FL0662B]